jgi:hypothetical protein
MEDAMPVSVFSRYFDRPPIKAPGPGGGTAVTSLGLRLPEETEAFPDSIIHTVVGAETLDMLSFRYYGREDLWWRILDANDLHPPSDLRLDSPELRLFRLQPGDELIIPPVRAATRFPRS